MAKIFDKAADLVDRIPDVENTVHFFDSLIQRLTIEDQRTVVNRLEVKLKQREIPNAQVHPVMREILASAGMQ